MGVKAISGDLRQRIEKHFNADYRLVENEQHVGKPFKDKDFVFQTIIWLNSITGLDINKLAEESLSLDPKLSGYIEYHLQNYLMNYEPGSQYRAFGRFIGLLHRNGYSIFDVYWQSHHEILGKYSTVKCELTKRDIWGPIKEPLRITNDPSGIEFYLSR